MSAEQKGQHDSKHLSSVHKNAVEDLRNRKRDMPDLDEFVSGIRRGDRKLLSQAITLVESTKPFHQEMAQAIIDECLPDSGNSVRIGITGVPGVGKSTFIEAFGLLLLEQGKKVAVLAVDPSSERSKGSILGDKTRMEQLAGEDNAYIRPSASGGTLGGVARKTRESIVLCEAAGFDRILVETVGVGQSETAVHSMVDFFLLLMLAGAGDDLQGIKRGIMELADMIAITKADGANLEKATRAQSIFTGALHLFPPAASGRIPSVVTCSALQHQGISDIANEIEDHATYTHNNNYFMKRRKEQASYWMYETINSQLKEHFFKQHDIVSELQQLEVKVLAGTVNPFSAAQNIINKYFDR
jgi:LAO/AO transport system kinase